jgi:hypothetical protein
MATFAKLNSENIVLTVESVHNNELLDNGVESEEKGIQFLKTLYNEPNAIWKQTSYNTNGGVHTNGGIPFRKNHASIGYTYDQTRDAFIPPKPFNSWILNENTCQWDSPVAIPSDWKEKYYTWDESSLSWKE